MAITIGTQAQIGLVLLDNGSPFTPLAGSTFTFAPTLTSPDTLVTIAPATVDASAGAVPLAQQFTVDVAGSDTATTVTLNASATAPDGTTATGTITLPVTAEAQQFSIAVTQLK